jgi:hypothetical protein
MSLAQRIETLRKRHAQLESLLHSEEHRPMPNLVRLRQFKREKLLLKDRITSLVRDEEGGSAAQQGTA